MRFLLGLVAFFIAPAIIINLTAPSFEETIMVEITEKDGRKIYYIDVGDMPKDKAEEVIKTMLAEYKGK